MVVLLFPSLEFMNEVKLQIPFKYFQDSGSMNAFTEEEIEKIIEYQGKKL